MGEGGLLSLFFHPYALAVGIWSLIGLVGGGALIYYTLIKPRRTPAQKPPDAETGSAPDGEIP